LNGSTGRLNILRTSNFNSISVMTTLIDRASEDQPWVVAGSVVVGGVSRDRVFVGNNDFNTLPKTATVDLSQDAATAPAPAGFSTVTIERGSPPSQDGPPVRLALHSSGVVYAAFERWTDSTINMSVVVTRDDNWGASAQPFSALGANGVVVAANQFIVFNAIMGQERLGADLAIAVDPKDSKSVWVAWCNRVGGTSGTDWTLHVRHSADSGTTWSADLRTITNAKNPSLAQNDNGQLALVYQQFTGTTWDTKLEITNNNWTTAVTPLVLHTAPSATPTRTFLPYLGDYIRVLAVANNFYGVFCGNNTPNMANFPNGVTYQRNANWSTHQLLANDNTTVVAPSIDPFFFHWSPTIKPPIVSVIPRGPVVPITRGPIARGPIARGPVVPQPPQPPEPPAPIGGDARLPESASQISKTTGGSTAGKKRPREIEL
jgi:hypothetical protein